ncbi:efflux transporter outer membrane subunit [Desulfolutivibrio sp.]|uniref:efflux transporter outer membrane subunit n=1 Tax=Desulfolutivibrio sp. TaxID=2773296 RepID=UPI002F964FF5
MTVRPVLAAVAALFPAVILGGCLAVGPDYRPPSLEAPEQFARTASQAPGQAHEALGLAAAAWWQSFDDPILNELVTRAMAANLDLAQARARVRQARAEAAIARAALFPGVDVTGNSTTSANGLLDAGTGTSSAGSGTGGSGGSASTGTGSTSVGTENASTTTTTTTLFTAGFDATWEIDIFGGKRREREAAQAALEADIWDMEATRLTLLAEVAENYMELRAAQEQLDIARRNLKSQEETVEVTRERFRLGLTSQLDVAQSEGQAASTAADPPRLTATVSQSIHRLGVLTGQPPESLIVLLTPPRPQPSLTGVSATGLPAELLSRRPDLRRAERELAAASAEIGAAVADLYPKFDLTAGLGLQGVSPSNIAGFSTWYWSVIPGVSWPLFDMGKARAGVEKQKALFDEALAAYRQAFHTALEDVENALASYYAESERRQRLAASVAAYEQARRLAEIRYGKGLTSFLDVLVIDASLYAAQTELSQSEAALRVSLVSLYKALGGGWKAASENGPAETAPGPQAAGRPGKSS